MLFGVLAKGPVADTKGVENGMYWVPLMLGVTKLLGLGIVWIARFTVSGVVLTVDWGSAGGPKLYTKSHETISH